MTLYKLVNNINEENEWFKICQSNNLFCIVVRKKTKYYTIDWDHISVNSNAQFEKENLLPHEESIQQDILDIFEKHVKDIKQKRNPSYMFTLFVGTFSNLPEEIVFSLAQELSEYLSQLVKKYYQ